MKPLRVEPVSPHIGAEIGNVDLTKPLANKQVRGTAPRLYPVSGHILPRPEDQL